MARLAPTGISQSNISSTVTRPSRQFIPQWDIATDYKYRDIVMFDDNLWIALRDHKGHEPSAIEPLASSFSVQVNAGTQKGTISISGAHADPTLSLADLMGGAPAGMVKGDYFLVDTGDLALPFTFTSGVEKGLTIENTTRYGFSKIPFKAAGTVSVSGGTGGTLYLNGDVPTAGDWINVINAMLADNAKTDNSFIVNNTNSPQSVTINGQTINVAYGEALVWTGDKRIGTEGWAIAKFDPAAPPAVSATGYDPAANIWDYSHPDLYASNIAGALILVDDTPNDGTYGHGGWAFSTSFAHPWGENYIHANREGRIVFWKLVGLDSAENLSRWDAAKIYRKGDTVVYNNYAYIATDDIQAGNTPKHAEINVLQKSLADVLNNAHGGYVIADGSDGSMDMALMGTSRWATDADIWTVGELWFRQGEISNMRAGPQNNSAVTRNFNTKGELYIYTGAWYLNGPILGDDGVTHQFVDGWMQLNEFTGQFPDHLLSKVESGTTADPGGWSAVAASTFADANDLKNGINPGSPVLTGTISVPDLTHPFNPWEQLGLMPYIDTTMEPNDGDTIIYDAGKKEFFFGAGGAGPMPAPPPGAASRPMVIGDGTAEITRPVLFPMARNATEIAGDATFTVQTDVNVAPFNPCIYIYFPNTTSKDNVPVDFNLQLDEYSGNDTYIKKSLVYRNLPGANHNTFYIDTTTASPNYDDWDSGTGSHGIATIAWDQRGPTSAPGTYSAIRPGTPGEFHLSWVVGLDKVIIMFTSDYYRKGHDTRATINGHIVIDKGTVLDWSKAEIGIWRNLKNEPAPTMIAASLTNKGTTNNTYQGSPLTPWRAGDVYDVKSLVLHKHSLYQSKLAGNTNNEPQVHQTSTEWEILGYIPDPPNQPNDGDMLIWDGPTNSFVFTTPTTRSKELQFDSQTTSAILPHYHFKLPGEAHEFIEFDCAGMVIDGAEHDFGFFAQENGVNFDWSKLFTQPGGGHGQLWSGYHGQITEKLTSQGGGALGEFGTAGSNLGWSSTAAWLNLRMGNWRPARNRSWSLDGKIQFTTTKTIIRATFQYVGGTNESFINHLSVVSAYRPQSFDKFGLRYSGNGGWFAGRIVYQ